MTEFTRSFELTPTSVDPTARTAEVIWTTGAEADRRDMEGSYKERLTVTPEAVNTSRLIGGPLLDSHRSDGLRNVLGVVEAARIEGGRGVATIRFSARPEVDPVIADVQSGVIRGVSIGYRVERWETSRDPTSGVRVRTAAKWTPHEISLVAVPVDAGARVRSQQQEGDKMPDVPLSQGDGLDRGRINAEIRSIASIAGLDQTFIDAQIDGGATVDQARAAAFSAMASRSGGPIDGVRARIGFSGDDPELFRSQASEALYTRIDPKHTPSDGARQFIGMNNAALARECLRRSGESFAMLSDAAAITRALHSTSDFPLILGDTLRRTLRQAYELAPAGVRSLGRETTAKDFRTKRALMLSEAPTLTQVTEDGEFQFGSMAESGETYGLATYGRIIGLSRQAIINDNLGAFTTLSNRLGLAAANFQAQFLVDLLTTASGAGPTMSDSVALFNASHGNLAGTGALLSTTTLGAARLALRRQTGIAGLPINVTPRYLLVPATQETLAEQTIAAIAATKTSDVNPFANLVLVVDPRLDAKSTTAWYVVAEPAQIDGLEYAYLEGQPGPQIETRAGFEIDGVQVKVRLDFGGAFVDWRGWYRNPGA